MGGFDAKLQGFAISPADIQICLRDDGTEWLLVRAHLLLKLRLSAVSRAQDGTKAIRPDGWMTTLGMCAVTLTSRGG